MPDPANLSPADPAELEQALAHALRLDGRTQFRHSGDMKATITAAHLVEHLKRAGFVVMRKPPSPRHEAPPYRVDGKIIREGGRLVLTVAGAVWLDSGPRSTPDSRNGHGRRRRIRQ